MRLPVVLMALVLGDPVSERLPVSVQVALQHQVLQRDDRQTLSQSEYIP